MISQYDTFRLNLSNYLPDTLIQSLKVKCYNENKRIIVNRDCGSPMKMCLKTSLVIRGPPLLNARVTTQILLRGLNYRCMGRLIRNVEEEWLGTVLFFE